MTGPCGNLLQNTDVLQCFSALIFALCIQVICTQEASLGVAG